MKYSKSLVILLLLAVTASAAPFTYSRVVPDKDQAGIIAATNKFNAVEKATFDQVEAAKKAADPSYAVKAYVPLTPVQYFDARVAELIKSYEVQRVNDEAALDANKQAYEQFNALPEVEKAKIRTAIAAAAAANP